MVFFPLTGAVHAALNGGPSRRQRKISRLREEIEGLRVRASRADTADRFLLEAEIKGKEKDLSDLEGAPRG